jgi:mRNA interferase RelE/StbE
MNKVLSMLENPFPNDSKNIVGSLLRRTDIGEYRIIYELENGCLNVMLIGKRNDGEVYRDVKRL